MGAVVMAETRVSVRELKSSLSKYLRAVQAGEAVLITNRSVPIGRIVPVRSSVEERIAAMCEAGLAEWSGKPLGPPPPPVPVRGDVPVSDLLIEDRE